MPRRAGKDTVRAIEDRERSNLEARASHPEVQAAMERIYETARELYENGERRFDAIEGATTLDRFGADREICRDRGVYVTVDSNAKGPFLRMSLCDEAHRDGRAAWVPSQDLRATAPLASVTLDLSRPMSRILEEVEGEARLLREDLRKLGTPVSRSGGRPFSLEHVAQTARIYAARHREGVSLTELGRRFGLHRSTVTRRLDNFRERYGLPDPSQREESAELPAQLCATCPDPAKGCPGCVLSREVKKVEVARRESLGSEDTAGDRARDVESRGGAQSYH